MSQQADSLCVCVCVCFFSVHMRGKEEKEGELVIIKALGGYEEKNSNKPS